MGPIRMSTAVTATFLLLVLPAAGNSQVGEDSEDVALVQDFLLWESEDPITDARETILFTDADGTVAEAESLSDFASAAGQLKLSTLMASGAVLGVVCQGKEEPPRLVIMNQRTVWEQEGKIVSVTVRFDDKDPVEREGATNSNGLALRTRALLPKALRARKVAVRYTDDAGTQYTHVFSLMGMTAGMRQMACQM